MAPSSKAVRVPRRFSGDAMRKLREAADLSLEQLAIKLGKSAFTVRDYELGRTNPTVQALADMADALDCNMSDLFVPEVA